ncbi:MAG: ABC transporter ATP-binding protein [Candidatus Sumerlaeia bacterium]|nr:ABC transporter ATP-binding protein [Candidatus Sumerlaeia bacterium]
MPATATRQIVSARKIAKTYIDGERRLEVLRGVDLDIAAGECVAIIGRSGSGKSTLLHILGALDRATSGEVLFNGVDITRERESRLARLRAESVGFIYQFHHLLPEFSAVENVVLPGMILGKPQAELVRRAEELLRRVGLAERLHHRPAKLSGGERQRVALARALMNDPLLVLADEPTGDLDQTTGQEVLSFVLETTVASGRSLVLVTHDPAIAARADRRLLLVDGKLSNAPV